MDIFTKSHLSCLESWGHQEKGTFVQYVHNLWDIPFPFRPFLDGGDPGYTRIGYS